MASSSILMYSTIFLQLSFNLSISLVHNQILHCLFIIVAPTQFISCYKLMILYWWHHLRISFTELLPLSNRSLLWRIFDLSIIFWVWTWFVALLDFFSPNVIICFGFWIELVCLITNPAALQLISMPNYRLLDPLLLLLLSFVVFLAPYSISHAPTQTSHMSVNKYVSSCMILESRTMCW